MDAIKFLDSICVVPGVPVHLENGGILEIIGRPDDSIFDLASKRRAVIVSRDPSVRLTARSMSLGAEPFKAELVSIDQKPYASERMRGSCLSWQITFHERESTRSPLAWEAIERLTPKGLLL